MVAKHLLPAGEPEVTLFEDKIKIRDYTADSEALPRWYTLAREDRTAELFLTLGAKNDREGLDGPRARGRRDELLAELTDENSPRLTVTWLIGSDGLTGKAADLGQRRRRFEKELPFALAVIRYADRFFFERHPELDQAWVCVEFRSSDSRFGGQRDYGRVTDYRVTHIAGESRRLALGAAALAALGIGALVIGKIRNRGG